MNNNYLIHFGNKNSGRYRRGSGEHPHQHDGLGTMGRGKYDSRHDRRVAERMERKEIRKSDGFLTRNLGYNRATYRRAAQISANNKGISKDQAKTEAKKAAWRNTGSMVSSGILMSVGSNVLRKGNASMSKGTMVVGGLLAGAGAATAALTLAKNHEEKKMARTGQYAKYLKSGGHPSRM